MDKTHCFCISQTARDAQRQPPTVCRMLQEGGLWAKLLQKYREMQSIEIRPGTTCINSISKINTSCRVGHTSWLNKVGKCATAQRAVIMYSSSILLSVIARYFACTYTGILDIYVSSSCHFLSHYVVTCFIMQFCIFACLGKDCKTTR